MLDNEDAYRQLIARLGRHYPGLPFQVIREVVARSRQDLKAQIHPEAIPELLEQLAQDRLRGLAGGAEQP